VLYAKEATGRVSEVVERLNRAVQANRFGVLGTIDLKAKMAEKGVQFDHECVILEVCNPQQAKRVLDQNPAISTSLPCRIAVYDSGGKVTVATVKPTVLLDMYSGVQDLAAVAKEVENTMIAIIDAACTERQAEPR
jgi:uncharacterized protein (DUF302 family)